MRTDSIAVSVLGGRDERAEIERALGLMLQMQALELGVSLAGRNTVSGTGCRRRREDSKSAILSNRRYCPPAPRLRTALKRP